MSSLLFIQGHHQASLKATFSPSRATIVYRFAHCIDVNSSNRTPSARCAQPRNCRSISPCRSQQSSTYREPWSFGLHHLSCPPQSTPAVPVIVNFTWVDIFVTRDTFLSISSDSVSWIRRYGLSTPRTPNVAARLPNVESKVVLDMNQHTSGYLSRSRWLKFRRWFRSWARPTGAGTSSRAYWLNLQSLSCPTNASSQINWKLASVRMYAEYPDQTSYSLFNGIWTAPACSQF